jgi:hypothetical protein
MRKYIIYSVVILFLLYSFKTYAAPAYGAYMPYKGKFATGYQNNTIFKHDLGVSYGNIKSDQHFYDISYGVFDWLAVDGKIGFGDIREHGGVNPTVDHHYGFAGGYGFRLRVLDDVKNKVGIITGFQHISVHPASRDLNGDKRAAIYDDWQVSLLSSKDIGKITPFAGGKLSLGDLIQKTNDIDRKNRPPRYYAGAIVGCNIKITKNMYVSVEGHFIDETSLSSGIYYTF